MDYEMGKGILKVLFDEMIRELSPESLARIAEKVSAGIRMHEICHESHVRKILSIEDKEKQADIANRLGNFGDALRFQVEAEEIRLSL